MSGATTDPLSEPIQVHFHVANNEWPPGALPLAPMVLPRRTLVPAVGSTVSEYRPQGHSIAYRVIGQVFAPDGERVLLELEAV